MNHDLIQRLLDEFNFPMLTTDSLLEFVEGNEFSVLLFSEDPARHKEALDVAVVLPELVSAFPQLKAAVIDRASEKALQQKFLFTAWPALVFMKRGEYLGNIIRIQNWDDYTSMIAEILTRTPQPIDLTSETSVSQQEAAE